MLALTDNAATAIRTIVEGSDLTEEAGIRFSLAAVSEDAAELSVVLVPEPEAGDEEVEAEGAHVFLDPPSSQMLADKVLDARVAEDGEVGFSFEEQDGGEEPSAD